MPRTKNRRSMSGRNGKSATKGAKRGRKPIFTVAQKRVLGRLIRTSLKDQLRTLVKSI